MGCDLGILEYLLKLLSADNQDTSPVIAPTQLPRVLAVVAEDSNQAVVDRKSATRY